MKLLIKDIDKFYLENIFNNLKYFDTPDNTSGGVFCIINGKYTIFFNENNNIKVYNWILNNNEIKDNHSYIFFINKYDLYDLIKYSNEIINQKDDNNINLIFTPNLPYNNLLFSTDHIYRKTLNTILTEKKLNHPYYHYDTWIDKNILLKTEVNDELTITLSTDSCFLFLDFFVQYYDYKYYDKNITNIFIRYNKSERLFSIFYIFNEFIYEYNDKLLLEISDVQYFMNDEPFYYMYNHHPTDLSIFVKIQTLYDNSRQLVYSDNKKTLDTNINIQSRIVSDGYDFHIPPYRIYTIDFPIEKIHTALKRFDSFAYLNTDCYVAELIFKESALWIIYEDGFNENIHIIEYSYQSYITQDIKFKINIILLYKFINAHIDNEDLVNLYFYDKIRINLSEDNKAFKISYNLYDNNYYSFLDFTHNTLHIHTHID